MRPEKKRANARQWPEQEPAELAARRKRALMESKEIQEEELPLLKRPKSSSLTTNKWLSESNPLKEPSPLGLNLDKSPSFREVLRKRLIVQAHYKKVASLTSQNLQVGNKKKDVKARVVTSDPIDKLKASNFPALLLKIGQWEYVSRHEGDLVAKCYFAKHKLVWEVLDGGLKNKIEIQWEDIIGLHANFPVNGRCTLTVTLGKDPLFFRETNPLPRKHTIWQATSDFTCGEASRSKIHYVECDQGVLNKHYEKLIHCDTRLNFLSQQIDTFFDKPFPEASINAPNIPQNIVSNYIPEMSKLPFVDINGMVPQPTPQCIVWDGNFVQKDILKTNNTIWQDVNHYYNPEGMILSTSKYDPNCAQKDTSWEDHRVNGWQDGNDHSNPVCNLPCDDYLMKQGLEEEFGNVSGHIQDLQVMSRNDSFTDFVSQLPAIASEFWFDHEDCNFFYPN